ncbi:hypothetical protein D3C86_1591070 [compost metagenome]
MEMVAEVRTTDLPWLKSKLPRMGATLTGAVLSVIFGSPSMVRRSSQQTALSRYFEDISVRASASFPIRSISLSCWSLSLMARRLTKCSARSSCSRTSSTSSWQSRSEITKSSLAWGFS